MNILRVADKKFKISKPSEDSSLANSTIGVLADDEEKTSALLINEVYLKHTAYLSSDEFIELKSLTDMRGKTIGP